MAGVGPKVGVIMPTHGENDYLADAIESVIGQRYSNWTLVVVSDGAAESTLRLADRHAAVDPRIRVVRQARAGVAVARTHGLRELAPNVELVAFLDHDDRWLPEALAILTGALAAAPPEIVGAHGVARFMAEDGTPIRVGQLEADLRSRRGVSGGRVVEWPIDGPTTFANLAFSSCIPMGTAVVRRAAIDAVGVFDPRATPADDYDMWLRLSRRGDFAFVDALVMEYRQHAKPTWRRPRGVGQGAPYVRRKTIFSAENSHDQAKDAADGFRACEREMVADALSRVPGLVAGRRIRATARELLRAALHAGGYLLGAPGPWHGARRS
jgi:glycosyltransferase involved in cell wall biosynthesis